MTEVIIFKEDAIAIPKTHFELFLLAQYYSPQVPESLIGPIFKKAVKCVEKHE